MRRLRVAFLLRRIDGTVNALRYLVGRCPLTEWETELILNPWPHR